MFTCDKCLAKVSSKAAVEHAADHAWKDAHGAIGALPLAKRVEMFKQFCLNCGYSIAPTPEHAPDCPFYEKERS